MRDSYERFFEKGYMDKIEFYKFGLNETISSDRKVANDEWNRLKEKIGKNKVIFIRGYGRNAAGTPLFNSFYEKVFGLTKIEKDPTNNYAPSKLIREMTNYSKSKSSKYEYIRNYQISHVFGRTKNIYAFTAPWNIVYTPNMLDPFTGHEAKGEMVEEYTMLFQFMIYNKFKKMIDEFNSIMRIINKNYNIEDKLEEIKYLYNLDEKQFNDFTKSIRYEFREIEIKEPCNKLLKQTALLS